MAAHEISLTLADSDATAAKASALAACLTVGDVVLLEGPVGAGKTHFARTLIQSILTVAEDVPSPTFTLVQTYETTRGEIWHADLYRLSSTHEIEELGLAEAFEAAICLIEWPDRLGDLRPKTALTITLASQNDVSARTLTATWEDSKWSQKLLAWRV